jgi:hypothetical protein
MPIRDDSNKTDKQKRTTLIFPLVKVDLVYYFAIHKENESKKKSIRIEIPPRLGGGVIKGKKGFVFLGEQLLVEYCRFVQFRRVKDFVPN